MRVKSIAVLIAIAFFSANVVAAPPTYIIHGSIATAEGIGVEDVDIVPDGGIEPTVTAADGTYSITVPKRWTGTVTVNKSGWLITPATQNYPPVDTDYVGENYTAFQPKISGYVKKQDGTPLEEVTVTANNGGDSDTTDSNGYYEFFVPYEWSGTVSTVLSGFYFTENSYAHLITDQTNQDFIGYQPTVSGIITADGVGLEGVTVTANNGLGTTVTDSNGSYSLTIPYGWVGVVVTPSSPEYIFTPIEHAYFNVTADIVSENYTAELVWSDTGTHTPFVECQKLVSDDIGVESFGHAVSVDGDYAVIGKQEYNGAYGAVYLFQRNGLNWVKQQKLTPSDSVRGDYFGHSADIDGDHVIVGAWGISDCKGAAYILKRNESSWIEKQKLTALDGMSEDHFGFSVSISGNYAVVGTPNDDVGTGSVYIFEYDGANWIQKQKLIGSGTIAGDEFGKSVYINDDYLIIGTYESRTWTGSAFIFKYDGIHWVEQQKILASDGIHHDGFGNSVAINSHYAIVGAPETDDRGSSNSGSVYVFKRDGTNWIQQQKILASDASFFAKFGSAVSIDGNRMLVGAKDDGGWNGSAYIFRQDEGIWLEQQKLHTSSSSQCGFGTSVSVNGDYAIIGSPGDDDMGSNSGSAHIFSPALILKKPDGGEKVVAGSSYDVCWDADNSVENIFLTYSVDNGSHWNAIDTISNTTGSYSWTVPELNSDQCLVGISNADNPIHNDVSNNPFRVFMCTLTSDINYDCFVNLEDYADIASKWSPDGGEHLHVLMNFVDEWLQCGDPYEPDFKQTQ
jgi:hypothetical protein